MDSFLTFIESKDIRQKTEGLSALQTHIQNNKDITRYLIESLRRSAAGTHA